MRVKLEIDGQKITDVAGGVVDWLATCTLIVLNAIAGMPRKDIAWKVSRCSSSSLWGF